ncbi:MAG: hypothetical protein EB039_07235, partial [Proteobacteria bacterium]|nr:hypothetical protein [Pseudomonadota bacterium]
LVHRVNPSDFRPDLLSTCRQGSEGVKPKLENFAPHGHSLSVQRHPDIGDMMATRAAPGGIMRTGVIAWVVLKARLFS